MSEAGQVMPFAVLPGNPQPKSGLQLPRSAATLLSTRVKPMVSFRLKYVWYMVTFTRSAAL
jgi:hypothetical protein